MEAAASPLASDDAIYTFSIYSVQFSALSEAERNVIIQTVPSAHQQLCWEL